MLLTAAAAVIVIAGIKAASDIVGPLMLALALTIVFHPHAGPARARLPSWAASVVVLVCAYVLILALIVSLVVALGRLAVLVPSYAPEHRRLRAGRRRTGSTSAGVGERPGRGRDGRRRHRPAGRTWRRASCPSVLAVLSNLFFLVALLLFLAFDAAKTRELAAGAREEHAGFVDAMTSFAHGTRSYLARVGGLRPDRRGDRHRSALGAGGAGRRSSGGCWRSSPTSSPTSAS